MNKRIKVIDFFKILICIIFLTIILSIISISQIENTNNNNKSIQEQKIMIEQFVSKNQTAKNLKLLFDEILEYTKEKMNSPEKIPTIEFYGKENNNKILMYTTNDEIQFEYYREELIEMKNSIKEDDKFFITYEAEDEYINKIVIEYNY